MKVRVIKNSDGSVSIIYPAGEDTQKVFNKATPEDAEYIDTDSKNLPKDRTYRNAWGHDLKERISVVREMKKEELRVLREPLLKDLDVQYMKALETGSDTTSIVKEKQRLRDITNAVDTAGTLDDVKRITL